MPYCSVMSCRNHSKDINVSSSNISYHRFPGDITTKEKWIDATGRDNWVPSKHHTICSEHFLPKDIIISPKKGYRYIKSKAVPTLKIVLSKKSSRDLDVTKNITGTQKRAGEPEELALQKTETKKSKNNDDNNEGLVSSRLDNVSHDLLKGTSGRVLQIRNFDYADVTPGTSKQPFTLCHDMGKENSKGVKRVESPSSSEYSSPRKQKMKSKLKWAEIKAKKQDMKIKRLQAQNRRLRNKINTLQDILLPIQEKYALTTENVTSLENTNVEVKELIARQLENTDSGTISTKQYSPALRAFALTLNFYSPRAYEYVRETFGCSLPHPRTLKKWYSKIGGEPGFTKEAFEALKQKADSASQPILATLVIDEMSIRRRIEWDGKKLHGYVDMGTGLEGDHLAEAKEALVFLVTAINANFKVPVAYFLVDGVTGLQRAELVRKCLEMSHEAGIKIVALTFDGCAANVSMASHLGCCFQTSSVIFEHPVNKDPVAVVLDPCHMIKLLRNTFESCQTILDKDGKKIQWKHIVNLNDLQYKEGLHLSNKLRDRHVNFHNERMKVKLATQLFSQSVAEAIGYCRTELKMECFKDSAPTENFLLVGNNVFDIFNSRNLQSYGFKKALNKKNAMQIFEYLTIASDYLRQLKMENGTLIVKSARKTGFLGFLGCIEALKRLYANLIEPGILLCLPFYKLSQDHLEHLFSNIRSHGGSNNNPTARQFVSAYKKILVHVELKDNNRGNCTALEQLSILNCSSAVSRINQSTPKDVDVDVVDNQNDDIEADLDNLSDFSNDAVTHIAGFVGQ